MKYLGLAIAVVVAVAAAMLVLNASNSNQAPSQQVVVTQQAAPAVREVSVYVAARDIPIGSVIDANMLNTRPWPEHLVVDGFVVGAEEGERIINTVARAAFKRNEPINKSKLVNPDDPNFLAGELPKGMRLVTMGSDEISAVAGFVFPGDRVDVLVTHRVLREDVSEEDLGELGAGQELTEEVTETLLSGVRVLAVDQRATAGVDEEGIVVPRTVSLEVSPEDAQKLRLAEEIGRLSLALRSVEDRDSQDQLAALTRPADLSRAPTLEAAEGKQEVKVRVVRGTQLQEEEK